MKLGLVRLLAIVVALLASEMAFERVALADRRSETVAKDAIAKAVRRASRGRDIASSQRGAKASLRSLA